MLGSGTAIDCDDDVFEEPLPIPRRTAVGGNRRRTASAGVVGIENQPGNASNGMAATVALEAQIVVIEGSSQREEARLSCPKESASKLADDPGATNASNGSSDDDDVCTICFEPWTTSGSHRIASLKCGHLYGQGCVERWLGRTPACPQCKAGAKRADVRPIFAKRLRLMDTAERERLLGQVEEERRKRQAAEMAEAKTNMQVQLLLMEIEQLKRQLEQAVVPLEEGRVERKTWKMCRKVSLSGNGIAGRALLLDSFEGCIVAARSTVAASSDGLCSEFVKISLVDTRSPTPQVATPGIRGARAMASSPFKDGLFAIGGSNGAACVFTLQGDRLVGQVAFDHGIHSLLFDRLKRGTLYFGLANGDVWSCDLADLSAKTLVTSTKDASGMQQAVHTLVQDEDGSLTAWTLFGRLQGGTWTRLPHCICYSRCNDLELCSFRPPPFGRAPTEHHVMGRPSGRLMQSIRGSPQTIFSRNLLFERNGQTCVAISDQPSASLGIYDAKTAELLQRVSLAANPTLSDVVLDTSYDPITDTLVLLNEKYVLVYG